MITIVFIIITMMLCFMILYNKTHEHKIKNRIIIIIIIIISFMMLFIFLFLSTVSIMDNLYMKQNSMNQIQLYESEQQNLYQEMELINQRKNYINDNCDDERLRILAQQYPNIPRGEKTLEKYNDELQIIEDNLTLYREQKKFAENELESLKRILIPFYTSKGEK